MVVMQISKIPQILPYVPPSKFKGLFSDDKGYNASIERLFREIDQCHQINICQCNAGNNTILSDLELFRPSFPVT